VEPWTVIHEALLPDVHEQPAAVLTLTVTVPPDAPILCAVGCTWYAQPGD
jgi:hypothetical protein